MDSPKIVDFNTYTESMKKTLIDKMFFVDKVDASVFVDFGCADGTLLEFMHKLFPEYKYIGYDIEPEMIRRAKESTSSDIKYFTNKEELISELNQIEGKKCIILNSVIHEVYSYSSQLEVEEFFKFVFSDLFDYIAVRDMMPNKYIDRMSDMNDVAKIRTTLNSEVLGTTLDHLNDFEYHWGSIKVNKNLYHFLLKYRYLVNWKREVKENYFPIYTDEFLNNIPQNYCVDYYQEFLLPFLKRKIYDDFQINLKETTHVKLIIRKFK